MTDTMVRTEDRSRTRRRRARKAKRTAMRVATLSTIGVVVAAAVVIVASRVTAPPAPAIGEESDGEQLTVLLATTLDGDPSRQADSLTLFGVDRRTGADPTALFIPTGTFGLIPGQASIEEVGKALVFGREALQETTIENLLGIVVDRTIVVSDTELARMVERMGDLPVEVGERLVEIAEDGRTEVVAEAGTRVMSGPEAVTYFTYQGEGESEFDRAVRAQEFFEALIARTGADPAMVDAAIQGLAGVGSGDARALADVLEAFAAATVDERAFDALAVTSVGGSSLDEVYDVDRDAAEEQVEASFAGSLPPLVSELGFRPRVELRNGVGIPEVGATVAALLVPEGFRVEVTGNTAEFGDAPTRIVVYGDDDASLALAQRVRSVIGTGEVEVGMRGQTVVDITIVIGRDFVRG